MQVAKQAEGFALLRPRVITPVERERRVERGEGAIVLASELERGRELTPHVTLAGRDPRSGVELVRGIEPGDRRSRVALPDVDHCLVGETERLRRGVTQLATRRAQGAMTDASAAQIAEISRRESNVASDLGHALGVVGGAGARECLGEAGCCFLIAVPIPVDQAERTERTPSQASILRAYLERQRLVLERACAVEVTEVPAREAEPGQRSRLAGRVGGLAR